VALSRLNPVSVEHTLIQFSKLMRYMLYINDKDQITLQQKEDYLRSYIDLQQLRFGHAVKVNFHFEINSPQKTIEPMLLIPFVENAFKHGVSDVANPYIDIKLFTEDTTLTFNIENSYKPGDLNKDESHGIGLNNVKRRLQLLYPKTHSLLIDDSNNIYKVTLQIRLK
jgi:two-component system LytT family sensor kinase